MTEQTWQTMVVRAWRDRDGLKVRFMAENADHRSVDLAVEATVESATFRFTDWLHDVDTAAAPPTDAAVLPRSTHDEDGGTTPGYTPGL